MSSRDLLKSTATTDFSKLRRRQLGSFSASILPRPAIRYTYYFFLFCLPFEERIGGLSVLGLMLAALTLLQPRLFIQPPPTAFWWFVTYVSVVAVSGVAILLDGKHSGEFTSELFFQLFRWCQLLVLFVIAYRIMTFEAIAKRSLLIFGLSCVLLAILQAAGVIATDMHGRMTVYDFNPNVVALLLSIALISFLGLAQTARRAGMRLLGWASAAVLLIPIVNTGSRGSQLALVIALLILLIKPATIPKKVKTSFIVMAVISSFVWFGYQIDTVRERWESTYYEGEIAGREDLIPVAWEMFIERPVTGWGPVYHYWEMNVRTGHPDGGDPHNTYLWVLKETGLLGGLPFFMGLWFSWRSAWKARESAHGSLPLALLLLILANNMKGTYLFYKVLWVLLAYALASATYSRVRSEEPSEPIRSNVTNRAASVS